ncbi:hypothetical protein [Muricoccus aerilatus]|uniref:hypothetical protein n=1 Tax=Muricoccus aerilatus TaxID=452982 RepID=UPI0005C14F22|nr:hypothetical protein [Roseomonas aerilata]
MTLLVLFATDYLDVAQGNGGGERNTHELCLAFQAAGDEPAVSCDLRMNGSLLVWSSRLRRKLAPGREYSRDRSLGYLACRG